VRRSSVDVIRPPTSNYHRIIAHVALHPTGTALWQKKKSKCSPHSIDWDSSSSIPPLVHDWTIFRGGWKGHAAPERSGGGDAFRDTQLVDAFPERQTLNKNRGGALCTGADGPRPGARRGGTLCAGADYPRPGARLGLLCLTAGRSASWGPDGPRVRRGGGSRRRRLDLAPGRDPVGEERS
jgi:hypothetical protein